MKHRELGNDKLRTSALGLGCMGLSQGYGATDDEESIPLLIRSLELGMKMLDTAMTYGQGHNERLICRALAQAGSLARTAQIATKFGIVRDKHGVKLDGLPNHVERYCDTSLARLGVEVIDLYYLHRVDPQVPLQETVGAMAELVKKGKVRHLGVCEVTGDQLEQAASVHAISAVQFEWSLLWREPEDDIIPVARRLGIGLVPYSPLGRGLLGGNLSSSEIDTSDFRRNDPRFHGSHLQNNLLQVDVLITKAATFGMTAAQLALAWLLAQGDDVVPIPGTRRLERLEDNAAASEVILSKDDLDDLNHILPRSAWQGERRSFAVPVTARSQAT